MNLLGSTTVVRLLFMKQAKSLLNKNTTTVALAAVVGCLWFTTPSHAAASNEELEKRLQRLEQIVENRQQLDLVNQVTQLQEAVETLRGDMDVQTRAVQELTERQQLYFQDMDQRIAALESNKKETNSPIAPLYPTITPPPAAKPASRPDTPATNSVPTPSAPAAPTTTIPANPQQDQAAYQQAYQYVLDKNYAQAITGLNQYLQSYPQGTYRANAHYWLGEMYLIENQPQQAQQSFNTVLNDYPKNSKAGDALLKLGYAYAALGDNAQAKTVFNQVVQQYPNTQLSRLAESRLSELS